MHAYFYIYTAERCDIIKKRICIEKNRRPCKDQHDATCGPCLDDYEEVDPNVRESPCERTKIEVPITAEIGGAIDLSTRQKRINMQTAFRSMAKALSDDMQRSSRNFKEINTNRVFLVGNALVFHFRLR